MNSWENAITEYSEECLTPHMKILVLKWDRIKQQLRRLHRVDTDGVTWVTIPYLAKCCGCHNDTMKRTLKQMHEAGYIKKVYKNKNTPAQMLGVRMNECVYDAHFEPLPFKNKGNGQKKFFCLDCGSRNVEVKPVTYRVLCKACGSEHYQTHKGKAAETPRKVVYLDETS